MLSKVDLVKRMTAAGVKRLLVTPRWMLDHVERPAEDLSQKSFTVQHLTDLVLAKVTNDRLPIHLGPLLYLFRRRSEFDRHRWNSNNTDDFIVDLSKAPDGYPLQSGETVVAASAEYFEFPDDLAGFVISRVGNHLSGIDVSTTFIDAGWPGIITFQITNVDSHPRVLKLGLEIARLFVFELSSPQNDAEKHARDESHHAGISWPEVFKGNRSPFEKISTPARLLAGPTSEVQATRSFVPRWLPEVYRNFCSNWGISAALPKYVAFAILVSVLIWNYGQQTFATLDRLVETWNSIESLTLSAPERRVVRMTVKKGSSSSSTRHLLNETRVKSGAVPIAFCRNSGFRSELGVKAVDGVIGNDNRELELTVELNNAVNADTDIYVEYVLFWRPTERDP